MSKKLFLILFLSLFILGGCAQKNGENLYKSILDKGYIIVGISFDSRPFGYLDSNGKVTGMEADLAREIAERLLGNKEKIIFKNITPQERIKAAMSDDVDIVISTMTINPQREKLVYFSDPYFVAGQVICVKKDSKISSYFDLNNKRVITILDTTGEKNIKN